MSDTIHPSDEQLTAFFDKQLPDRKLEPIQSHLTDCPECRSVLSDFAMLQDLGPRVEERMPSSLYWEDLPDRVLARIAMGEHAGDVDPVRVGGETEAAQPAPSAGRSWWRYLWSPAVRWSAATAVVAVAGLAIMNSGDKRESSVADLSPVSEQPGAMVASAPTEAAPRTETAATEAMEPAEYAERIAHTLARDGNLGTQLDGTAGRASGGYIGYSPIQTVSLGLMDNNHQVPPAASRELRERPQQPNPEWYFFTALSAEAHGRCDLAQAGYRLASVRTGPQDPIHLASEAALTRCAWRAAMVKAGSQSASTLDLLRSKAEERFAEHAAGRHQDCVKAWELWVSYLDLGKGSMTPAELREAQDRLRSLTHCVE